MSNEITEAAAAVQRLRKEVQELRSKSEVSTEAENKRHNKLGYGGIGVHVLYQNMLKGEDVPEHILQELRDRGEMKSPGYEKIRQKILNYYDKKKKQPSRFEELKRQLIEKRSQALTPVSTPVPQALTPVPPVSTPVPQALTPVSTPLSQTSETSFIRKRHSLLERRRSRSPKDDEEEEEHRERVVQLVKEKSSMAFTNIREAIVYLAMNGNAGLTDEQDTFIIRLLRSKINENLKKHLSDLWTAK